MKEQLFDEFLEDHKIEVEITDYDLKNIPKERPFLIFANRKFKGIDEFIWLKIFSSKGIQPQFFAPSTPEVPQALSGFYVSQSLNQLDPSRLTVPRLHEAMAEYIKTNTVLIIFMDHPGKEQDYPKQLPLSRRCIRAALKLGLPMLPVNLEYDNPYPLLNEIIDPSREPSIITWPVNVSARIGASIRVGDQQAFKLKERFRKFLRSRIYALGSSLEVKKFFFMQQAEALHQDLTPAVDPDLLAADIQNLTYGNLIASQSDYDVLMAKAQDIPNAIHEIGRLRELTFRG
ncbi:MAG: hypothetical protein AAF598_22320, partial [Bacteroidota bacterium]